MADNFNLRAFLSENKLTKNAQLMKEVSDPGFDTLMDVVNAEYDGDEAIAAAVRTVLNNGDIDISEFGHDMNAASRAVKSIAREIELNKTKETVKENTMTTREQKLVKMVQEAMGTFTDLSQDQFGLGDKIKPIVPPQDIEEGEDIVEEKPLPQYESVEDLMKEIEHGTNKAMYEYKISEMKRIAKQLEEKVTTLEESEHAAHINPADVKKMKKDILTLHKGVAKIEKEYDRKFNKKTKTSEPKKEEAEKESVALAENRRKRLLKSRILSENKVSLGKKTTNTMENFDLKKFLVENKLTASSKLVKENSDLENTYEDHLYNEISEQWEIAGLDGSPTTVYCNYGRNDLQTEKFEVGDDAIWFLVDQANEGDVISFEQVRDIEQWWDESEMEAPLPQLAVYIGETGDFYITQ